MICKDGAIDVISIGGSGCGPNGGKGHNNGSSTNGHNTLQNRRKSQLITFSSSSCDIKNSLSHEIILVNNSQYTSSSSSNNNNNSKSSEVGSRHSSVSGRVSCNANARLSYADEDLLMVTNGGGSGGVGSISGSGSGSNTGSGSGSGHEADLEDDVFRRRSLEVDDEVEADFDDEFETHIEGGSSNNANDDSGGGSYEDSHALQSSIGGSNRNSLEKDDDEIDVDVISTDVSCYDQLLGTSCNTRNDDDIAKIVGDNENYKKLCKNGSFTTVLNGSSVNGGGVGVGVGENCGIIYANPFMDDEGIAESGM